jgi:hypothetical protein
MAFACTEDGKEGIAPANNVRIPLEANRIYSVGEAQFHRVIDRLEALYAPIIKELGGRLQVARRWTDPTANASASRQGRTWLVTMYGGLARHSLMTDDSFALVLCHELGHHIGGVPQKRGFFSTWASNEGQSDYWGNLKCMRRYLEKDEENESVVASLNVPANVRRACERSFSSRLDNLICQRTSMAGLSLAKTLAALRAGRETENPPSIMAPDAEPDFETPSQAVVERTDDNHPEAQCRLDTYFQGALCEVPFSENVSNTDATQGVCAQERGRTTGVRPRCWYKPDTQAALADAR